MISRDNPQHQLCNDILERCCKSNINNTSSDECPICKKTICRKPHKIQYKSKVYRILTEGNRNNDFKVSENKNDVNKALSVLLRNEKCIIGVKESIKGKFVTIDIKVDSTSNIRLPELPTYDLAFRNLPKISKSRLSLKKSTFHVKSDGLITMENSFTSLHGAISGIKVRYTPALTNITPLEPVALKLKTNEDSKSRSTVSIKLETPELTEKEVSNPRIKVSRTPEASKLTANEEVSKSRNTVSIKPYVLEPTKSIISVQRRKGKCKSSDCALCVYGLGEPHNVTPNVSKEEFLDDTHHNVKSPKRSTNHPSVQHTLEQNNTFFPPKSPSTKQPKTQKDRPTVNANPQFSTSKPIGLIFRSGPEKTHSFQKEESELNLEKVPAETQKIYNRFSHSVSPILSHHELEIDNKSVWKPLQSQYTISQVVKRTLNPTLTTHSAVRKALTSVKKTEKKKLPWKPVGTTRFIPDIYPISSEKVDFITTSKYSSQKIHNSHHSLKFSNVTNFIYPLKPSIAVCTDYDIRSRIPGALSDFANYFLDQSNAVII